MAARALFLLLFLTGCSGISVVAMEDKSNYITFEHPFTDEAEARVRGQAEGMCRQRKQAAIKTERTCSLTKCFTNYQCVDRPAQ
jgi:hypothetical protein